MTPLAAVLGAGLCAGLALLALPGSRLPDPPGRPRPPGHAPSTRSHPAWPPRRRGRARRGQQVRLDAPLLLDLVAAVVDAGAPPASAVLAVARVVAETGSRAGEQLVEAAGQLAEPGPWRLAAARPDGGDGTSSSALTAELLVPLHRCLVLAEQTGAPVAALLRSSGDEVRRRHRRRSALAAARLGVRVVAPLGLCTLPAFALLGVVPVLLSLGRGLLG